MVKVTKLNRNVEKDRDNKQLLEDLGWKVIIIWECEIKKDLEEVTQRIVSELQ